MHEMHEKYIENPQNIIHIESIVFSRNTKNRKMLQGTHLVKTIIV